MQFIVLVSRNRLIVDLVLLPYLILQLKKTDFAVIDDGSTTAGLYMVLWVVFSRSNRVIVDL